MTTPRLLSNRYELGETLGYGGMSEVHRGRDVRLGREVAVKVLRADLARDPQFQERFRREAQNAAALNHPAIVAVYDTGEGRTDYGPLPYIVMEYVDGRTLRDIVKTEGPLPGQRAMEIMADVCAALDFSHRHGIVHRDVKPANVMITKTGAVKVMDFGIARAVADGQVAVTQTAAVIGTAQYLSPEQAKGEAVDARSDVYAAGCVLFELLTGEPPFTGDSPVAVAYQHVREDPRPPSALNPRVSPVLDAVVLKAMSKGAPNRYQSAAEMRADLVRVLSGQRPIAPMVMTDDVRTAVMTAGRQPDPRSGRHRPPPPPPPQPEGYDPYDRYDDDDDERRRRRRGWLIALGSVAGLALIALIAWLISSIGNTETPSDLVAVPNVIGQTQAEAQRVLRDQGFINVATEPVACQPGSDGTTPCGPDNIGKVIDSDPKPNSNVKKTDKIILKVGAAPEKISVPDLTGKTPEEAAKILEEAKLTLAPNPGSVQVEDEKLVGKIAEQNPPAGQSVNIGTQIAISLGKAPDLVSLPDVTGQPFEKAKTNLENLGFKVVREDVPSRETTGTVVSQDPGGGKQKPGTTVTLSVAKQDQSQKRIQVPDLTGKTPQEAENLLRDRGWTGNLQVVERTVLDPREDGKIIEQQYPQGTEISPSDNVGVLVGKRV